MNSTGKSSECLHRARHTTAGVCQKQSANGQDNPCCARLSFVLNEVRWWKMKSVLGADAREEPGQGTSRETESRQYQSHFDETYPVFLSFFSCYSHRFDLSCGRPTINAGSWSPSSWAFTWRKRPPVALAQSADLARISETSRGRVSGLRSGHEVESSRLKRDASKIRYAQSIKSFTRLLRKW